jgi:hypothetical protein
MDSGFISGPKNFSSGTVEKISQKKFSSFGWKSLKAIF